MVICLLVAKLWLFRTINFTMGEHALVSNVNSQLKLKNNSKQKSSMCLLNYKGRLPNWHFHSVCSNLNTIAHTLNVSQFIGCSNLCKLPFEPSKAIYEIYFRFISLTRSQNLYLRYIHSSRVRVSVERDLGWQLKRAQKYTPNFTKPQKILKI